jgi:hypothetical protein
MFVSGLPLVRHTISLALSSRCLSKLGLGCKLFSSQDRTQISIAHGVCFVTWVHLQICVRYLS